MTSFTCASCGQAHEGLPTAYRFDFPEAQYGLGGVRFTHDDELAEAGDDRFILANIELPMDLPGVMFVWTCWISLSKTSYERMIALWQSPDREQQEPAFGRLSIAIPTYEPTTFGLKTKVHTRPPGLRPWVELEPTQHPLAIEQRDGIRPERIAAVYHVLTAQEGAPEYIPGDRRREV